MPSATARDFQRVARLLGFVLIRQTGSHERWNHPDGRAVTIPEAAKSARHFHKILRQRGVSLDEFEKLR